MNIMQYLNDGISYKIQAIMKLVCFEMSIKFNDVLNKNLEVFPWYNGREQGYILSLKIYGLNQFNIIVYEHRSEDKLCAVCWEQYSLNPITIDTADFDGKFQKSYDVDIILPEDEVYEMAKWIEKQFINFVIHLRRKIVTHLRRKIYG